MDNNDATQHRDAATQRSTEAQHSSSNATGEGNARRRAKAGQLPTDRPQRDIIESLVDQAQPVAPDTVATATRSIIFNEFISCCMDAAACVTVMTEEDWGWMTSQIQTKLEIGGDPAIGQHLLHSLHTIRALVLEHDVRSLTFPVSADASYAHIFLNPAAHSSAEGAVDA